MLTLTVDASGSTPREWKTRKWSAVSARTRKRVGEMFSPAVQSGAVDNNERRKQVKRSGRISIRKDQVIHWVDGQDRPVLFGGREQCVICGEKATHLVLSFIHLPLCTTHFPWLFVLPATRHPKKARKIVEKLPGLGLDRRFVLRRHLKPAYVFNGRRTQCDMVNELGNTWYFSCYDNHDRENSVLSVTRILPGMKATIHIVRPNVRRNFTSTLRAMMKEQFEICAPGNKLIVEEAASRFLDHILIIEE